MTCECGHADEAHNGSQCMGTNYGVACKCTMTIERGDNELIGFVCKDSKFIKRVTYVRSKMEMKVYVKGFGDDHITYVGVPSEVYDYFKKTESKGRFFNRYIRGKYNGEGHQ